MESVLQSQLKQLKSSQRNEPTLPKNSEATFLFDFQSARRVDVDTIFSIGYYGLIELSRHNPSFTKYFQTLFNNTSKYFNRDTKKDTELKDTDIQISQLLIELIPYFRHKATHKVLEFLIKIYNIHVYNAKSLFLAFLPYHESRYFTKLIQNINFEQFNTLSFFGPYVKNGVVVLKEALYKELASNMSFLREVINYYENVAGVNNVDESEYFVLLSNVFTFILMSANRNLDVNTINLILQFITKVFKSFMNKSEGVVSEYYEDNIIPKLCELITGCVKKVNLNQEYIKAILNDLIGKVLIYLKNGNGENSNVNNLTKLIINLCVELNKSSTNGKLLFRESLNNINNNLEELNNYLEDSDIFSLMITILNSTTEEKIEFDLVKKIMKTNCTKISDENIQKFITLLFDLIYKEENANKNEIVNLLSFIEETHGQQLNLFLIKVFSNATTEKKYLERVIETTKSMSKHYGLSDDDNEINAFNLFINLNSTNISTVLFSIKKLDSALASGVDGSIIAYSVPSLSNKFSFLDSELVLEEILNMSSFKTLINNYPSFKNELVNFYFKLHEDGVKIYSNDFRRKIEECIITNCINDQSEYTMKILIFVLFFGDEGENTNIYVHSLFGLNSYLKNLIKNSTAKTLDEIIINFFCTHNNKKLNAIYFFKCLFEIFSVKVSVVSNVNFNMNLNKEKFIYYIKKILNKDIEKIEFLKTISLEELEIVISILNIEGLVKLNSGLFEILSQTLIDVIPVAVNENYSSDIIKILFELTYSLINNNGINILDKLLKHFFKNNSQIFLSQLILRRNITNNSFYSYIKDSVKDHIEVCLLTSLMYSITISEVDTLKLIEVIESSKKIKITKSSFNSNCNTSVKFFTSTSEKVISSLRDEIVVRRNEIILNKKFLTNFIHLKCDGEIFTLINEVYINNMKVNTDEDLISIFKIFNLFIATTNSNNSSTKTTSNAKDKKNKKLMTDLISFYKSIITKELLSSDAFIRLLEKLLQSLLNLFSSSFDVIILLLDFGVNRKYSEDFINSLFSKENFNLDIFPQENLTSNIELTFKIIKFALKHSINSDVFLSKNSDFGINLLSFIHTRKLVLDEDAQYTIYYLFEIIFKNNNSNFTVDFVIKTLDLLTLLRNDSESNLNGNNTYLNISNNLLTIISNCTVESEEKEKLKKCVEEIEINIFSLINKFKDSNIDSAFSLELVHIVNTLFLCLNKLISQFTKIEEEREIVKSLITRSFEILNADSLTHVVKDEVYLIFINAIKNFIELLFESHSNYLKGDEQYEIFYEYIHYFVKFTLTLTNFRFKEGRVIENILTEFVSNKIISSNDKFLACLFINLFYYNFSFVHSSQNNSENKEIYTQIIFNFFNLKDKEENPQFTKLCLDIILSILDQLANSPSKIFFISAENSFDPYFLALNFINKVLPLIENSFFTIHNVEGVYKTLLNICLGVSTCRRHISNKMKNKETTNSNYNFYLKELKQFEEKLFNDLNVSKLLHKTILSVYNKEEYVKDKHTRNYLLNKYLEIIVTNNKTTDEGLITVFEFLLTELVIEEKEENIENLQIVFAILTRILNNQNSISLYKVIRHKKNLDILITMLVVNVEKPVITTNTFYHYSIFVFLSKVFTVYGVKLLDKLNDFLSIILTSIKALVQFKNEELTTLFLDTFKVLSQGLGEYFSPYLNEIVFNLLIIIDEHKNNSNIISLVNSILENIAKKQLLDNTFNASKFCVKKMNFKKEDGSSHTSPIKSLMNFLKISLDRSEKLMITGLFEKILKFFIKLLLNNLDSESILECFKCFTLKINEKQLKLIFADILKFAKEKGESYDLKYKLDYSIVAFELLNTILKTITVIFVPYFEKYKKYWTDLILYTNAIFSTADKRNSGSKKTNRSVYDAAYDDEENKFSYLYLNSLLLENVALNFKYNTDNGLLNETVEELLEPLVGQVKFIFFENEEEKLFKYFDANTKKTFIEIFKNIKSEDIFKDFNDMIMNLIREDHYLIKLLTLRMIQSLFDELKERYVVLVQDVLPYVSDCLEDSNERVSTEAFKLMKSVEKLTGEDLKEYLDN